MAERTRELTSLLDSLAAGEEPSFARLAALSDLDREGAAYVAERWGMIPATVQRAVLERANELAEDNVDLEFSALARAALSDADARARAAAVGALWESEAAEVGAALSRIVCSDPDEGVRAAAARGLASFVLRFELGGIRHDDGDPIVAALRGAAETDESVDVRAASVEALSPYSASWVSSLITDAYYDGDAAMRTAALRAMGHSADDQWLDLLFEQLQSDDPVFRFEAAGALQEIGSEDAVPELADLLAGEEDGEVAAAAIVALGQIGGEAAIEALDAYAESVEGPLGDLARESVTVAREAVTGL